MDLRRDDGNGLNENIRTAAEIRASLASGNPRRRRPSAFLSLHCATMQLVIGRTFVHMHQLLVDGRHAQFPLAGAD